MGYSGGDFWSTSTFQTSSSSWPSQETRKPYCGLCSIGISAKYRITNSESKTTLWTLHQPWRQLHKAACTVELLNRHVEYHKGTNLSATEALSLSPKPHPLQFRAGDTAIAFSSSSKGTLTPAGSEAWPNHMLMPNHQVDNLDANSDFSSHQLYKYEQVDLW